MALTREQILSVDDGEREEVTIPEWNGSVFVKVLSAIEKDYWEKKLQPIPTSDDDEPTPEAKLNARFDNVRARTAVLACCDASGAPLFVMTDVEWLGKKSGKALDKIWTVFTRLNGIGQEEVDTLVKNSPAPTADDASGLPLP